MLALEKIDPILAILPEYNNRDFIVVTKNDRRHFCKLVSGGFTDYNMPVPIELDEIAELYVLGEAKLRLAICQESGIQFNIVYNAVDYIQHMVPFDDVPFGRSYVAKLNEKTDLPFYLQWIQMHSVRRQE